MADALGLAPPLPARAPVPPVDAGTSSSRLGEASCTTKQKCMLWALERSRECQLGFQTVVAAVCGPVGAALRMRTTWQDTRGAVAVLACPPAAAAALASMPARLTHWRC